MPKRALSWMNTYQHCKKRKDSTRTRTLHTADYIGPCGDSFCYASRTMTSCNPTTAVIYEECEKELSKKKEKFTPEERAFIQEAKDQPIIKFRAAKKRLEATMERLRAVEERLRAAEEKRQATKKSILELLSK